MSLILELVGKGLFSVTAFSNYLTTQLSESY